jgi:hypothetical protein
MNRLALLKVLPGGASGKRQVVQCPQMSLIAIECHRSKLKRRWSSVSMKINFDLGTGLNHEGDASPRKPDSWRAFA